MDSLLRTLLVALPDDPDALRAAVRSVSIDDWPSFLERLNHHGLTGVVSPYLDETVVPKAMRPAVDRQTAVRLMWGERLVQSLEEVVQWFDAAAIRVCVLKGPVLASRLYNDATARSSIDLDLLFAPEDFEQAVAILRDHGYSYGSEETASYLRRHSHHLQFSKPGALAIEAHFQAYAGFGMTLPASALLDRAVPFAFGRRGSVLIPAPEDEYIYLSIHAAGHYFVRLLWLCDLKLLLLKNPSIDWDAIAARAGAAGVATPVGYATELLTEWLALPLASVASRFPHRGLRRSLADALLPMASNASSLSRLDNLKGLLFSAMLCDRPRSTVWFLQHHLLRSVRRRAQRTVPGILPESWAG